MFIGFPRSKASPPDSPDFARRALSTLARERFTIKQQDPSLLRTKFNIYDPYQTLRFVVREKLFSFQRAFVVYTDKDCSKPVLRIKACKPWSLSTHYQVKTTDDKIIGRFTRKTMRHFFKDEWLIFDASDTQIGRINEDSSMLAFFRHIFGGFIPQTFSGYIHEQNVVVYRKHSKPINPTLDVDFLSDEHHRFDRRLGIASAVLLLASDAHRQ